MHAEAARIRRGYYIVTLVLVVGLALAFTVSHYSVLKRADSEGVARLRETITEMTKGFLEASIQRTIADIDLERVLARKELRVAPGDAVAEARADAVAKERVKTRIRETRLGADGYIWVHEILDFDGGPNYARRLVHRFLLETEGDLLSTEPRDGDFPYLAELESIKRDGEAFNTYYFPRPGEQLPALKLSFSRLYPDFSWVIGTGIFLDDVERIVSYETELAEANIRSEAASSVTAFLFAIGGVLAIVFAVDRVTGRAIRESYERIQTTEQALRDEKRKVEEAYALMKNLAERDELTGLRNRRSGMNRLTIEAARAKRSGAPFCVAIGDIDHFKAFNDKYGHETGDLVLKNVAAAIESGVRLEDMAARWGGEEFLILFSEDDLAGAIEAAERIRVAVSSCEAQAEGTELCVTITLGLAQFDPDESVEDLIARADEAMYKGKAAGRDTVVASPPPLSRL